MNKQHAALLSIISNTVLIIFKLTAGIMMSSVSVISEAIHSSLDLLASLIAFLSIRKAVQPVDADHPFGHGKYENVSGFVEAILILFAAMMIIYEAVKKLIYSSDVSHLGAGMLVMLVSSLINLIISLSLLRISKKTKSLALEADAMHLLTDVFTSFGVFLGLVLLNFTHMPILDPIVAMLVALLIIKTSIDLIRKSMKDLVDESLPDDDIKKIVDIISSHPEITSYHRLRTRKCGETVEMDIHLRTYGNISLEEAHALSSHIETHIKETFEQANIVVHVEPEKNLTKKVL